MITMAQMDTIGIGLDEGAWNTLSRDVAQSLLRVCEPPSGAERSYTGAQILPTPNGRELYVRTSLSG